MRGRKRHRKKRDRWKRLVRYGRLLKHFKEGRIFLPSRLHTIDTAGNVFDVQAGVPWERLGRDE